MSAIENPTCAQPEHNPEWWTGYKTTDHATAAVLCQTCPAAAACRALAEAERTTPNPPLLPSGGPMRPRGVYAGRLYDGTTQPPLPVRVAETCTQCSRTFVPHHVLATRCDGCRAADVNKRRRARRMSIGADVSPQARAS